MTEDFFHLGLAHAGVAVGVEQHRFGGDQRALAVHVDRAAFIAQRRSEALAAQTIEHAAGQAFVQVVGRLAAPGVEAPAHPGQTFLRVNHEARAGVAAPAVVDRQRNQFDVRPAQGFGVGNGRRINDHFHRFEPGDGIGDAGEIFLHQRQGDAPARFPQGLIVWPDHPGRRVRHPLCRHHPTAVVVFVLLHGKKPFELSHCVQ
ncbi:hypothetical protein D3C81_1577370 [compost metagenome]